MFVNQKSIFFFFLNWPVASTILTQPPFNQNATRSPAYRRSRPPLIGSACLGSLGTLPPRRPLYLWIYISILLGPEQKTEPNVRLLQLCSSRRSCSGSVLLKYGEKKNILKLNYSFKYATCILIQIKTSIIKDAKFVTCVLSAVLIRITGFNAKKYKKKYISEAKCSFFFIHN